MEYTIKVYETISKKRPFQKWLDDLSDMKTRTSPIK